MSTPTPRFGRWLRATSLVALALVALLGASCGSLGSSTPPKYFVQFFMEAPPNSGVEFTLPVSGLKYHRLPGAFLNAADVQWIQPGTVDVNGVKRVCVFFQFNALGQRELYLQTGNNLGRRIFLFANDKPMGVRYLEDVIQNGQLFMFVETTDTKDYEQFVVDLQSSQERVKEMQSKK